MSNTGGFSGFSGFGSTPANNAGGAAQQPAGTTPATNVFGAATGGTGSLFGGGGGSNIFGGGAANANPSTQAPKPFGGFGTFGSTTPAAAGTSNAAATTTPAAPSIFGGTKPPALNFGASTTPASTTPAGGGLFGGAGTTTTPSGSALFGTGGGNLFGAKPATPAATTTTATSTTPATGFGASNAPPPTSSLFGNLGNPSASTTTPATGGGLFGTTPGATTPAGGNLFGAGGSSNASTITPATNLFGPKPDAAKPAATTTTPAAGGGFSGFSFGNKDGKDAKDAAPTQPAPPSLFGNLGKPGATTPAATTPAPTTAATTAPAPAFNLFGAKPDATAAKDKDAKDAPKPALSLFGTAPTTSTTAPTTTAPTTTAPAATTTTSTTTQPAATTTGTTTAPPLLPPSVLKGKSLEDIVDQWNADLEAKSKEFKVLAEEVMQWDKVLIDNGNHIANLYAAVLQAEKTQSDVEKSLDHIEDQQKQLSDALDGYERATEDILQSQGMRGMDMSPADAERERNYALATTLNSQLDELARQLSSMVDEVNSVTGSSSMKPSDSTLSLEDVDPMTQVQAILNAHLDSLTWINSSVRELEGKVGELETKFGTTYQPSSSGIVGQKSTVLEGRSGLGGSGFYGRR